MAWYDPNWNYRKPVTITENSGSTLSSYQVLVSVSYVSGKMNADFSDLRFTASDGTTLLDYWIESYTASTSASVWVEVPTITASTTTDIYMYYGNSGASTTSNIKTTFVVGDDFNDGSIDTSVWVQDSEANFLGGNASQTESGGLFYTQYGGIWSQVSNITDGYAWKARLKWQGTFQTGTYVGVGFGIPSSSNNTYTGTYATKNLMVVASDNLSQKAIFNNTDKGAIGTATSGTFYTFEGKAKDGYAQLTFNGTSWTQASGTAMSGSNRFGVYTEHWAGSPNAYIDYCYVRKYTASEPTYSTGSEETGSVQFTKDGIARLLKQATFSKEAESRIKIEKVLVKEGEGYIYVGLISGQITNQSVPVNGAKIMVFQSDDEDMTNLELLGVETSDALGNWSSRIELNKVGWAAAFYKEGVYLYRSKAHGFITGE